MQIHMVSYKSWKGICMWGMLNIVASTLRLGIVLESDRDKQ